MKRKNPESAMSSVGDTPRDDRWTIPLILLLVSILAFALLIPFVGFYWDDWLVIFHLQTERYGDLITLYAYDRPYSFWTALLSGSVLAVSPADWQIFALLIRWLVACAMWWALRALWPEQSRKLAWAALLFLLYPAYFLQPISVAFSQHWIAYGFFFLSLGAMGWAVRYPQKKFALTVLAFTAGLLHLVTLEYFAGLELIRPLYLFILFSQSQSHKQEGLKRVFRHWWPYLLLWMLWLVWRLFLLKFPVEPHPPQLLLDFQASPLQALFEFLEVVLQSFVNVIWSAWQQIFNPGLIDFGDRFGLLAWLVGALAGATLFYLGRRFLDTDDAERHEQSMAKWGIVLGLIAIFAGLLPIWAVGEKPLEAGYNERFALPALFGAALVWVGGVWLLVKPRRHQIIILSVLLGLAVASHLRAANQFRWDWQSQQRFYQQLAWRAPGLKAGTALIAFEPLTDFMPASSTSAAINTLYPQSQSAGQVDYWAFELTRTQNVKTLQQRETFESSYRGMHFEASDASSTLFFFNPPGGCLWVLTPLHVENEYVPFENRELLTYSNLAQITREEESDSGPDPRIFGRPDRETWCYFFQKAELARQFEDWQQVVDLMAEAQGKGLGPNYGIEWLPLVEAQARLGNWQLAEEVSRLIHGMHSQNDSLLCALWDQLFAGGNSIEVANIAWQNVREAAHCELN